MFSPPQKNIGSRPPDRLASIPVAILDSNPNAAELYRTMLERLGFKEIHLVNDGFESVQLLKKTPIALMLADVELKLRQDPQRISIPVNGIDLIKRLRHSPVSPNPFLPIIMLLDRGNTEQALAARDAGANGVVFKPLGVDDLCACITEIVECPRLFITATTYKGPCRRRKELPFGEKERRKRSVCIIRYNERPGGVVHAGG